MCTRLRLTARCSCTVCYCQGAYSDYLQGRSTAITERPTVTIYRLLQRSTTPKTDRYRYYLVYLVYLHVPNLLPYRSASAHPPPSRPRPQFLTQFQFPIPKFPIRNPSIHLCPSTSPSSTIRTSISFASLHFNTIPTSYIHIFIIYDYHPRPLSRPLFSLSIHCDRLCP